MLKFKSLLLGTMLTLAGNALAVDAVIDASADAGLFPFNMPWDDASANVTDLSYLNTPITQPITVKDGHLFDGQKRVRMFGVNMTGSSPFALTPDSTKTVARLAKFGVNLVRLHSMDGPAPYGLTNADRTSLSSWVIPRLDHMICELGNKGMYVNLGLHSARIYPSILSSPNLSGGDAIVEAKRLLGNNVAGKGVDAFYPEFIQSQKDYAKTLLKDHKMSCNGKTYSYADSPNIAFVEINNEANFHYIWDMGGIDKIDPRFLRELNRQWQSWLTRKYGSLSSLRSAWRKDDGGAQTELAGNSGWGKYQDAHSTAQVSFRNTTEEGRASQVLQISNASSADQPWYVQLYRGGLRMTEGKTYTLGFWAKANAMQTTSVQLVRDSNVNFPFVNESINLSTQWRYYSFTITPNQSSTDVGKALSLRLNALGKLNGSIYVSDVSLKANLPAEMVREDWYLWNDTGAVSTQQTIPNAGPTGKRVTSVNIRSVQPAGSSHVQLLQAGLKLEKGKQYTLSFWGKSDVRRELPVYLMKNSAPWNNYGANVTVSIDNTWRYFSLSFMANGDDDSARLNFPLGQMPSTVSLSDVSLRESHDALRVATNINQIGFLPRQQYWLNTLQQQRDWLSFVHETDKKYFEDMRRYLKNDLGVKALVIGTQVPGSSLIAQENMDVIDVHDYWQHPESPAYDGYNRTNWKQGKAAMAGDKNGGILPRVALRKLAGKPFMVSEYNHAAPNTYSSEAFLEVAAMGSVQDWDAITLFSYSGPMNTNYNGQNHSWYYMDGPNDFFDPYNSGKINNWFTFSSHSAKMATLSTAAAIFRRGDVRASGRVVIPMNRNELVDLMRVNGTNVVDFNNPPIPALSTFNTMVETALTTTANSPLNMQIGGSPSAMRPQLTWNTQQGYMTINSINAKAFIGNNQMVNLGEITIDPKPNRQNWSAISMLKVKNTENRYLVTATGFTKNQNMAWNVSGDHNLSIPTDNWGNAPVLVEGIPARIVFNQARNVSAWALDERGNRKMQLPVSLNDGKPEVNLQSSYQTLWYEVLINQ